MTNMTNMTNIVAPEFVAWPSIESFGTYWKNLSDIDEADTEVLGFVKVHGTNACTIINESGIWTQSRGRMLSVGKDNQGFHSWVLERKDFFRAQYNLIQQNPNAPKEIRLYGEFAGKGIADKVGVCNVDKFFYMFPNMVTESESWQKYFESKEQRIISCLDPFFQDYLFTFNKSKQTFSEAYGQVMKITLDIEEACPVAKFWGVDGLGEGLVWYDEAGVPVFKSKGEKHQHKIGDPKALKVLKDFTPKEKASISYVSGERMFQAYEHFRGHGHLDWMTPKLIPEVIKYVIADIEKEEGEVTAGARKVITQKIALSYKQYMAESMDKEFPANDPVESLRKSLQQAKDGDRFPTDSLWEKIKDEEEQELLKFEESVRATK